MTIRCTHHWGGRRDDPISTPRAHGRLAGAARSQAAAGTARKAWRFAGEMDQIAAGFAEAGLPDGFARAAADLYRRLAPFKDVEGDPPLDQVLERARAE